MYINTYLTSIVCIANALNDDKNKEPSTLGTWMVLDDEWWCNPGTLAPPLYRSFTDDQPGSLEILVPPGYSLRGKGSSHVGSEVLVSSQTCRSAPIRTLPRITFQFPREKRHLKRIQTLQETQVKDLQGRGGSRRKRWEIPYLLYHHLSPWLW